MKRSGALADMKKRGISWLFYCNVDNALIQIADPAFIGVATEYNHPIATKVIEKTNVDENEPNAYKLERFIFDFFPLAEQMTVLMGLRKNEFAPVKNKEGEDSPESARKLVFKLHREWLMAAGVPLEKLPAGDIEISPLLSYGGEGLNSRSVKELLEKD